MTLALVEKFRRRKGWVILGVLALAVLILLLIVSRPGSVRMSFYATCLSGEVVYVEFDIRRRLFTSLGREMSGTITINGHEHTQVESPVWRGLPFGIRLQGYWQEVLRRSDYFAIVQMRTHTDEHGARHTIGTAFYGPASTIADAVNSPKRWLNEVNGGYHKPILDR